MHKSYIVSFLLVLSIVTNNYSSFGKLTAKDVVANDVVHIISDTLCGEDFLVIDGQRYDAANPTDTLLFPGAGVNGCDSLVYINLLFKPHVEVIDNRSFCEFENVLIGNRTFNAQFPSGEVLLTNEFGCDSLIIVDLSFDPLEIEYEITNCPGQQMSDFTLLALNGTEPPVGLGFVNSGAGSATAYFVTELPYTVSVFAGMNQVTVSNANCAWLDVIDIPAPPSPVVDIVSNSLGDGLYELSVSTPLSFSSIEWIGEATFSCSGCLETSAQVFDDQVVELILIDPDGCVTQRSVELSFISSDPFQLYIPNIISLSAPSNSVFFIQSFEDHLMGSLEIYDAWGNLVFADYDFMTNDKALGWNGTYQNRWVGQGVYTYCLKYFKGNGDEEVECGSLTMIK